MIGLQKEGKIRHLALSNVSLEQLREGMAKTSIVGVQNLYNVAAGEKKLAQLPHAMVAGQEQIVDSCAAADQMVFLPFFPLAIPGPRAASPGARPRGRREAARQDRGAGRRRVAAREVAGDPADRRDELPRAPRGELGREDDRPHQGGHRGDQRGAWEG